MKTHTQRTNMMGVPLTEQGARIADAIEAGLAAMTPSRWRECEELAREFDDEGEWFAPEFAAAREATAGITWEFSSWRDVLHNIEAGYGRLGGVSLLEPAPERRTKMTITKNSTDQELMDAFEFGNNAGDGFGVGAEIDTPFEAAGREEYRVLRRIMGGTNVPGEPVFCEDGDDLVVIANVNGPWAVTVGKGRRA